MATRRTQLTERWHWLVIIMLAAVPVITMAMYVIRASPMQFNDYWDILPRVTNPDGSFSPRGALTYQNEHPVALPGFIYWVNAKVSGGSNNVLGLYVVAVGIITLVVLVRALPSDIKADRALRGTLVVVFAALLFAPRGIHNFVFAMSGTAWLTANALACIAILVAWRWNPYAAVPLAALAALSYGTGLATFPVLVLIAVLQQRPRRLVGILSAATALAAGLYLSQYESPPWAPGASKTVMDVLRRSLQVLGAPFVHDPEVAGLVGALLPCVAGVAIAAAHRQGRLAELAPWIGVIVYGIAGSLLIGWSRGGLPDVAAIGSRYVSVGVVAWAATFVVGGATLGRSRTAVPVLAAAALIAFVAGQRTVTAVVDSRYYSNELAIALRIGAEPLGDSHFSTTAIPTMRLLDHYPFNDDFDLDCGMLGEHIDTDAIDRAVPIQEDGIHGGLEAFGDRSFSNATEVNGWVSSDGRGTDCVLIVDDRGTVIGASAVGRPSPSHQAAGDLSAELFVGVGLTQDPGGTYRAVAVVDDDLVLLNGVLRST